MPFSIACLSLEAILPPDMHTPMRPAAIRTIAFRHRERRCLQHRQTQRIARLTAIPKAPPGVLRAFDDGSFWQYAATHRSKIRVAPFSARSPGFSSAARA